MLCLLYLQDNVNSIIKFLFFIHLICPYGFSRGFHHCHHKPPKPEEVQHVFLEPSHILKKRSSSQLEPQPLRIHVVYHDSVHALPADKNRVITKYILPQALDYWKKALRVRRLNFPILLSRRCLSYIRSKPFVPSGKLACLNGCENVTMCGEVVIPNEYLEPCYSCDTFLDHCHQEPEKPPPGIKNSDFVFFVSALKTDRCHKGLTVAYAAHCQQDASTDRPIAGHANLCPDSISTKPQDLDTLLSTVKHEILHALGFSVSLYAYFRSHDGTPLTERESNGKPQINKKLQAHQWSTRVIREVTREGWKVRLGTVRRKVQMLVTPRVVEEVRRHFNCSTLEGAELEDQGEDGTSLTHWEKRVFENEAMTGTHTQNPVYSRITLALMEDTGWFFPNYDMAQQLKWGKNLGCDFAMKSCKDWIDSHRAKRKSIHPFCDKVKQDPLETECTDNRDSVALCNLMEYEEELPVRAQNFDYIPGVKMSEVARYGGSVVLADYCPYIQEFTWKSNDVVVRGSQCLFPENSPAPDRNFALEYYGPGSKCFNHNKEMWEEKTCTQVRQWQHWGSGCYKYKCHAKRLHLIVTNHTYTCYYSGQEIKIQLLANNWLHTGTIICPSCKEICQEENIQCEQDIITATHERSPLYATSYKDELVCSSPSRYPCLSESVLFVLMGILVDFIR